MGGGEREIVFLDGGFEETAVGADNRKRRVILPSKFVDTRVGTIEEAETVGLGFEREGAFKTAIDEEGVA